MNWCFVLNQLTFWNWIVSRLKLLKRLTIWKWSLKLYFCPFHSYIWTSVRSNLIKISFFQQTTVEKLNKLQVPTESLRISSRIRSNCYRNRSRDKILSRVCKKKEKKWKFEEFRGPFRRFDLYVCHQLDIFFLQKVKQFGIYYNFIHYFKKKNWIWL